MGKKRSRSVSASLREELAEESARLMIEHGIADFGLAKRKAAERFAVTAAGALPSNVQIQACLAERQRIFEPDEQPSRVAHLRRLACDVMDLLEAFDPRLVGAALNGTATVTSNVELHVFSDTPELVAMTLGDNDVRYRETERRYRFGSGKQSRTPGFEFRRDGETVVAMVFPENGVREAPLSTVDRKPMNRMSRRKLRELLST